MATVFAAFPPILVAEQTEGQDWPHTTLKAYSSPDFTATFTYPSESEPFSFAILPDGRIAVCYPKQIVVFQPGTSPKPVDSIKYDCKTLIVMPDGRLLVAGTSGAAFFSVTPALSLINAFVTDLAISVIAALDNTHVVIPAKPEIIKVWEIDTSPTAKPTLIATTGFSYPVAEMAPLRGLCFAARFELIDNGVGVYCPGDRYARPKFTLAPEGSKGAYAFLTMPDGKTLVTAHRVEGDSPYKLGVWNAETGESVAQVEVDNLVFQLIWLGAGSPAPAPNYIGAIAMFKHSLYLVETTNWTVADPDFEVKWPQAHHCVASGLSPLKPDWLGPDAAVLTLIRHFARTLLARLSIAQPPTCLDEVALTPLLPTIKSLATDALNKFIFSYKMKPQLQWNDVRVLFSSVDSVMVLLAPATQKCGFPWKTYNSAKNDWVNLESTLPTFPQVVQQFYMVLDQVTQQLGGDMRGPAVKLAEFVSMLMLKK